MLFAFLGRWVSVWEIAFCGRDTPFSLAKAKVKKKYILTKY
jgi:hypothetical protein